MIDVLLLSNGHGEDGMAAALAEAIKGLAPDLRVAAYPLVGEGGAYARRGITRLARTAAMPSGGFILEQRGAFSRDVRAGLLREVWRQIRRLRRLAPSVGVAVAVGDVYPLALAGWFLRRPLVFLPTAKSDYIRPHYGFEVRLMRRACRLVFPRDARTAASLAEHGVPAEYAGNLMMDQLAPQAPIHFDDQAATVALMPGSRAPEAYRNAGLLLGAVEALAGDARAYHFLLPLAGGLDPDQLLAGRPGWRRLGPAGEFDAADGSASNGAGVDGSANGSASASPNGTAGGAHAGAVKGLVARLLYRPPGEPEIVLGEAPGLRVRGAEVGIFMGRFADVLHASDLALGMAGTANEQAAGLGIPVIAPPGRGPQFTRGFVVDQMRLLGDAVVSCAPEPEAIAALVRLLLADPERMELMGDVGRERMGEPGATARVAQAVVDLVRTRPDRALAHDR